MGDILTGIIMGPSGISSFTLIEMSGQPVWKYVNRRFNSKFFHPAP